ncbi:MAG: AzlD domain-containing protein [Lachnospiraceae bacterium]|nr:AzlD domain-containing protein [Lachnospiraceae bacterium]
MSSTLHTVLLVLVAAVVTLILRALPFVIFGGKRKMPAKIKIVADSLPPAVMAVLVVFCLKGDIITYGTTTVPALISCTFVVLVHLWKKNTLLSIFLGTVLYMVLIRVM